MINKEINPREPLKSILVDKRQRCQKALEFYEELMRVVPEEETWKYAEVSIFYDNLGGLVYLGPTDPVSSLKTIMQTIDEYLTALDEFSDDQFAAFLLGVGLTWIPIRYWGMQELHKYYAQIKGATAFYEKLLAETPEDEHWKFKKSGVFDLPAWIPHTELMPMEILKRARELVESMIAMLADRPF